MRSYVGRVSAVLAALILLVTPIRAQNRAVNRYKELPAFHRVNDNLYRGGQPKRGGLARLANLGIKTVIDLRTSKDRAQAEETETRALGLQYFHLPLRWYGRPKHEQVQRVLEIINQPKNRPVFVHCNHGVDRTGLIVAVYRMAEEGWTSAQAKAEARHFGLRWWKFGLKEYISDYYNRRAWRGDNALIPAIAQ